MVLEYQLTATYAAGSLGGTLGRLNEALMRLSRADNKALREPVCADENRLLEAASIAHLKQTLRLMTDAWRANKPPSKSSHIELILDQLKENALTGIAMGNYRPAGRLQYQLLAQVIDRLKNQRHPWT